MPQTFSDHARHRLLQLYNSHPNEVGRLLKESNPTAYANYCTTDCITYAINVMSYAFEQIQNPAAARRVRGLGAHGNELSRYLVEHQN